MSETYQLGGIFQAIIQSKETKPKKSKKNKKEDNDEIEEVDENKVEDISQENDNTDEDNDLLTNLFSQQPAERPKSFSEEDIKNYINDELLNDVSPSPKSNSVEKKSSIGAGKNEPVQKKKKQKEDPERVARTVFVGNVSVKVDRKMLRKIFNQFGEIETIRIRSVPAADPKIPKKVALIKKEFHNDRDNMTAYIVFKTEEAANKSLKSNGTLLEGLHLRLDKVDNNKKHDHKSCIFVGNLPFGCSEESIRNHFKDCGTIDDVRIIRDKNSGLGKGFGYVKFINTDGVMFGLKLNGSTFEGRKLRISRSKENPTSNKPVHKNERRNFGGLRATSKKDLEKGKKLFSTGGSTKKSNALRRIKSKNTKQKQTRNKERNLNRKAGKNSKIKS